MAGRCLVRPRLARRTDAPPAADRRHLLKRTELVRYRCREVRAEGRPLWDGIAVVQEGGHHLRRRGVRVVLQIGDEGVQLGVLGRRARMVDLDRVLNDRAVVEDDRRDARVGGRIDQRISGGRPDLVAADLRQRDESDLLGSALDCAEGGIDIAVFVDERVRRQRRGQMIAAGQHTIGCHAIWCSGGVGDRHLRIGRRVIAARAARAAGDVHAAGVGPERQRADGIVKRTADHQRMVVGDQIRRVRGVGRHEKIHAQGVAAGDLRFERPG